MEARNENSAYLYDLRTNGRICPLGIDCGHQAFSWKMQSNVIGQRQTAYRIVVKKTDGRMVWDSGKVMSDQSHDIVYGGDCLEATSGYTWELTVWDQKENMLSASASFETALPTAEGFGEARWISAAEAVDAAARRLPVFRRSMTISKNISCARLYSTALGVYENFINGERVGVIGDDGRIRYHELKPGSSEMAKRKFYSTYDVTAMLHQGENVLAALTGNGWWNSLIAANYGKRIAYLCKLVIRYTDGTVDVICTDESWKAAEESPMETADIYNGESYDAQTDLGFMRAGYDDSGWSHAEINHEYSGEVTPWIGSPIIVRDDLERHGKSVTIYQGAVDADENRYGRINILRKLEIPAGAKAEFSLRAGETALIDFGQNAAGWEAFTVSGRQGTVVTIEHGEILNDHLGEKSRGSDGPGGSIYNLNYRSAKAQTNYTLSGTGEEHYHPTMTYYGFRYIEITATDTVHFKEVTAQVVTSVEEDTGEIVTSHEKINRLVSLARWGQYSNYLSVPTDCPQRDERYGWMADTQVFAMAGCYLGNNRTFLEKFLQDVRDAQPENGAYGGVAPTGRYGNEQGGTGWADAGVIVPYILWQMYGDVSVIKTHWASMVHYVDGFLGNTEKHGPVNIWGDWVAYESNDGEIQDILAAAYYAWDAQMMAEMAGAAGFEDQIEKYNSLFADEKTYFIENFVTSDGKMRRGEQSVCLYALYLDLLPDRSSVDAVTDQLLENIKRNGNRLQTGFLGTKIILDTLTKIGRNDVAYTLLFQEQNPSWLYTVNQGATTVWERWNSYTVADGFADVGMNSFNHYAYGAVAGWMFATMAGIGIGQPGFKRICLAPAPDRRLPLVRAEYQSAYGPIKVESEFQGELWQYGFAIPANTTAEIRIPVGGAHITVDGSEASALSWEKDGIVLCRIEDGIAVFDAAASKHTILVAHDSCLTLKASWQR
ncbi:alpha-L-rhamnosidase [uncultured Acetatifactor sp.]|uniref:alpha-L-rhamnosidase n=1 Tax=uncultured Acetatifactor sp. TaxID=1671927 RepID=UPI002617B6A1|nr:alpha-L-rhamnosidase [uncultured Acetatifactor sp.]